MSDFEETEAKKRHHHHHDKNKSEDKKHHHHHHHKKHKKEESDEYETPISLLNLLIEKDESVIDDLKTIFETLDNGDAMDIDGIEDEEMRQILLTFFKSLHIDHVGTLYEWKDTENKLTNILNEKLLPYSKSKIKCKTNSLSLSPSPQPIKTIGPELPPSLINNQQNNDNEYESDSDEDIGPALPGEERLPTTEAIESLKSEINEQVNPTKSSQVKREEWMTEMPSGETNFASIFQKKTRFARRNTDYTSDSKEERARQAKEKRDKEYVRNLDRGPSLVEQFRAEKKSKKIDGAKEEYHWDRERDFVNAGKTNLNKLLKESKDYLSSNFK